MEEIKDKIRKAGIACAIIFTAIVGGIAMAILIGQKNSAFSEIRKLEEQLSDKRYHYI